MTKEATVRSISLYTSQIVRFLPLHTAVSVGSHLVPLLISLGSLPLRFSLRFSTHYSSWDKKEPNGSEMRKEIALPWPPASTKDSLVLFPSYRIPPRLRLGYEVERGTRETEVKSKEARERWDTEGRRVHLQDFLFLEVPLSLFTPYLRVTLRLRSTGVERMVIG